MKINIIIFFNYSAGYSANSVSGATLVNTSWTFKITVMDFCLRRKFYFNYIPGDPEVTANLYCNFSYPYLEGCVIFSIYLR